MIVVQPVYLENKKLADVLPVQVDAYLIDHEFQRGEIVRIAQYWNAPKDSNEDHSSWKKIVESPFISSVYVGNEFMSIMLHNAGDYRERTAELLVSLGAYEGRLASDILDDMLKYPRPAED